MTAPTTTPLIRRLQEQDIPHIESHYLRLGPEDRRARFGAAIGDDVIIGYVRRLDPARATLVGAFDETGERLVGIAEAQPTQALHRVEIAISVDASVRHCGIGLRLVRSTLAIVFAEGNRAAEFFFAADNRSILGLVRALGAWISPRMDCAEISSLAAPSPRSTGGARLSGMPACVPAWRAPAWA